MSGGGGDSSDARKRLAEVRNGVITGVWSRPVRAIAGVRAMALGLAVVNSLLVIVGGAAPARAQESPSIAVETRAIPGRDVKEVTARGRVGAPPHVVRAVIADLEHYAAFMPYVKESRALGRDAQGAALNYQRLSFGIPFVDDRHYVIRVVERRHRESDGRPSYAFVWQLVDGLPDRVRAGAVRVSVNSGYWALRPIPGSPDATDVRYCVFTDPAGALPKWMVGMANTEAIPKLFAAVASAATNSRYAAATPPTDDDAPATPIALDRCAEP